ncbi:MAG: hypothetical protein MI754_09585, partial [Chromatiales bacterium]|nr:hypothetical protein [Chromatiales bacterium]
LCGQMDGINWRVTLSPEGEPLIYDSMHNCGCYHQFFPTRRLVVRPPPNTLDESAFVPARAPDIEPGQRLVLRIASRTHHIEAIYAAVDGAGGAERYQWADYDQLRAMPLPDGGSRSLFEPVTGLIAGTARKERWILWPMGIPSPGAMRQWGHHATAFVGKRYFDDPCLMAQSFDLAGATVNGNTQRALITDRFCGGHNMGNE